MNLAWWLEHAADEAPDKVALIEGRSGISLTYGALRDRAEAVAAVLRDAADVGPDDVVATLMPDNGWHVAVFYGVLRLGAVFSGFNRTLGQAKFAMDIERSRVRVLVVAAAYRELAQALQAETCVETVLVCEESEVSEDSGTPNLCALTTTPRAPVPMAPRISADIAAVNFTGGTSGVAKGVIFTHGKLGLSGQASVFYERLTSRDINLSCISLYHSGGIQDAVKWVMAGATNLLMSGWDGRLAVRLLQDYRPTWIYFWVPTMVRDLMRQPEWEQLPLDGVGCLLAGETVQPEMHEALAARGMRVSNGYGMTETMPIAILKPQFLHGASAPPGSCGRPNRELCEVVLKDPETGAVVDSPGIPGEVCVRGEVVTPGYHNDPERTAAAVDDEGYLHTQDMAQFDASGDYWLAGRADDIINTGGEKLSLVEVENVLRTHPALADVACIGVAHQRFGMVPGALFVPVEDCDEAELAAALDAHCLESLERWKRPRLYGRLAEIPRTMPKRTKNMAALRELVAGIELDESQGMVTLGQLG